MSRTRGAGNESLRKVGAEGGGVVVFGEAMMIVYMGWYDNEGILPVGVDAFVR